jgi:hypothetical protein
MTKRPEAKGVSPTSSDEDGAQGPGEYGLGEMERSALLKWVGENLTDVRRSVSGQRFLYWSLGIGFALGLAAHVGGYAFKSSTTTEPLGLIADLLYALGYALWTAVVVVVFVQIIPEAKRRQMKWALDAYEAERRDESRAGSDRAAGSDGAPTAGT